MFVAINNADIDFFKVDALINRTCDANAGIIAPEFVMNVLFKTNH